jgi:hypothetical protein
VSTNRKLLVIESCEGCPHYDLRGHNGDDWCQGRSTPRRFGAGERGAHYETIPDWCPLPDAPKEKT